MTKRMTAKDGVLVIMSSDYYKMQWQAANGNRNEKRGQPYGTVAAK